MLRKQTAKRVLVVTDQYFSRSGKALEIGNLVPGAEVRVFDEVTPDPAAELAAKGAALCVQFRPELLIALGGGSPMDCAKGIRLAAGIPMTFAAIPTTCGSGSEVTSFSILTSGCVKHALVEESLRPDLAILDDTLLSSIPQSLLADTGMDLLAHCLEAVAARKRNGFTDAFAAHGAMTVLEKLRPAWEGTGEHRGHLLEAACMAGMAFDNAGLGLCHAMAHVLGGAYHIPHGRLCAMLLPHVMEANADTARGAYARLARVCGLSGATERLSLRNLITAIVRLRTSLGMPATLRQAGADCTELQKLVPDILQDACCATNPVPPTAAVIGRILKAVSG